MISRLNNSGGCSSTCSRLLFQFNPGGVNMSQFFADNFISHLKEVALFEGERITEEGLKKGRFNEETAALCDPETFLDIRLSDFPQVVVTATKNAEQKWTITGGCIGVGEDHLSPFDNEAIAGYVLALLGYDIPVTSKLEHDVEREPGVGVDGSYFIPNVDNTEGILILPNTHRQVVLEQLEHDAKEQVVIGRNDLDDTAEIIGSYLGEKGMDIDPEMQFGILAVNDGGSPYRIDKITVPTLNIEFEVEMLYCLTWEARISSVKDLSLHQEGGSSIDKPLTADEMARIFGTLGTASVRYQIGGEAFSLSADRIDCLPDGQVVIINLD